MGFCVAIIGNLDDEIQQRADTCYLMAFILLWMYLVGYHWCWTAYWRQLGDSHNVDDLSKGIISPELFDVLQSEMETAELFVSLDKVPDCKRRSSRNETEAVGKEGPKILDLK